MSAAAVLEWATAEGVRLVAREGRITWQADHQPPPALLERLREHRQSVLDALARQHHQYRAAVAQEAGVPWEWLAMHFFTLDDLADIDAGHYPDPVALGELIRATIGFFRPYKGAVTRSSTCARILPAATAPYSLYASTTCSPSAANGDSLAELTAQGLELAGDDRAFIRRHLTGMTPAQQRQVLADYATRWLAAMDGHPEHKQQNAGRFAANCWLRASSRPMQ